METKLLFTSLINIPTIVLSLATLILIGLYAHKRYKKQEAVNAKLIKYLAWAVIGFRAIYAVVSSALQYYTWEKDTGGIGQFLLPPHKSISYFASYSWIHFFAGMILSVGFALVFYLILKVIKKYRAEILGEEEPMLGLACALIVGWPNAPLFIMLSFVMLLIVSAARQAFFKEQLTTITLPLLISLPIILLLGSKLIEVLHLNVLII